MHNCEKIFLKNSDKSIQNIMSVMKRYEKALEFFEKNSLEVNLDGLFGLRVSQGKLIIQVLTIFVLNFILF
jgi:hypothetical protein